jgi:hypothetical protein
VIVPIDPLRCASLSGVVQFDIYADGFANMVAYLETVVAGTVIVCITIRNPSLELVSNLPLVVALNNLGVYAADVNLRGSVAFVAQKGYNKTLYSKSIYSTSPSASLNAIVTGKLFAVGKSYHNLEKRVTPLTRDISL